MLKFTIDVGAFTRAYFVCLIAFRGRVMSMENMWKYFCLVFLSCLLNAVLTVHKTACLVVVFVDYGLLWFRCGS